jgi:hypothetical protein
VGVFGVPALTRSMHFLSQSDRLIPLAFAISSAQAIVSSESRIGIGFTAYTLIAGVYGFAVLLYTEPLAPGAREHPPDLHPAPSALGASAVFGQVGALAGA